MESKQSGDVPSLEDLSWLDSCLIKDPEISESNWDSLKDALLEIISYQPDSLDSSATDIEILPSSEETESTQNPERTVEDEVQTNEAAENKSNDHPIQEKTVTLLSRTKMENAFRPTYNDELRETENSESNVDLVFPAFVIEPSTEDIFKVRDLDIPTEEDELIKQFNKALSESSLLSTPPTFDDYDVWKGLKEESVDDLSTSIANLSLNQKSG